MSVLRLFIVTFFSILITFANTCPCPLVPNNIGDDNEIQSLFFLTLSTISTNNDLAVYQYHLNSETEIEPETIIFSTCLHSSTITIPSFTTLNDNIGVNISYIDSTITLVIPGPTIETIINYELWSGGEPIGRGKIIGPVRTCHPEEPVPMCNSEMMVVENNSIGNNSSCNCNYEETSSPSNKSLLGLLGLLGLIPCVFLLIIIIIIVFLVYNRKRTVSSSVPNSLNNTQPDYNLYGPFGSYRSNNGYVVDTVGRTIVV